MANHIWVGVKEGVYTVAEFPFYVGSWKRECKETNPLIELAIKDGTPKNPIRKDEWDNYWLLLNAPEELTKDVKNG